MKNMNDTVSDTPEKTVVTEIPTIADSEAVPNPESRPQPDESSVATPHPDVESLVAEAEQRGYMRGRNEALAERMNEPGLWQLATTGDDFAVPASEEVTILNGIRPGVWDCF